MPKDLPSDLTALTRWLVWKYEKRNPDKDPTKVPYSARTGAQASSTDPNTWSTFEEARTAVSRYDGLGFALGNGVGGIDLDHCRNPQTGAIEPWAQTIIKAVPTYTEVSPSGTGVHLIFLGTLPPGRRTFIHISGRKVEMYDSGRYFTVTGEIIGSRAAPQPQSSAVHETWTRLSRVLEFHRWALPKRQDFDALWDGTLAGDKSDHDMALVHLLIAFTKGDERWTDAMFRLSGRMRDKWDEVHHADGSTYGQGTIKKALEKAAASAPSSDAPLVLVPRWWADLKANPPVPPRMIVNRLMLERDINMIAGPSYAGKSTLALDLALSIATGIDALGQFKVPTPGRVLYVYAEHHEGAWWSNLQAVAKYRGFDENVRDLPVGLMNAGEFSLANKAHLGTMVDLLLKTQTTTLILDPLSTLASTVEGDSENDASAVIRTARKPLQFLIDKAGVSVIPIHHSAKAYQKQEPFTALELVRGSSDLQAMTGSILGVWACLNPRGQVKCIPHVRGPQAGAFMCGPFGAAPVEKARGRQESSDPAESFQPLGFFEWASAIQRDTPELKVTEALASLAEGMGTAQEIADMLGKATKTVQNHLHSAVEMGLVERTGKGTYRIAKAVEPGAAEEDL